MSNNITVIAVGGSLIVPHLSDTDGIDVPFLRAFRKMLLSEIKKGRKFVLVAGGGKTARLYRDAALRVQKASNEDLDWVGIAATKLNAELLRVVFKEFGKSVVVEPGTKPGWSTDYISISMAKKYGAKDIIIAGDTPFVYEKDPRKFPEAKPLTELTWSQYEKLVPKKWTPGLSSPVDPIATQLAKKLRLEVRLIRGTDMQNFQNAIEGKKFIGTTIR